MRSAVFVAPFFLDTTLRFVDAAASLSGVRLGLVSQDPLERRPDAQSCVSRDIGLPPGLEGSPSAGPPAIAPPPASQTRCRCRVTWR